MKELMLDIHYEPLRNYAFPVWAAYLARRNDREEIHKKLAMDEEEDEDDNDEEDLSYDRPILNSRLQSRIPNNLSAAIDWNTSTATNVTDLKTDVNSTITHILVHPPRLKIQLDELTSDEDYQSKQEKLQPGAKMALTQLQASTLPQMQFGNARQIKKNSPVAIIVGLPGLGEPKKKFTFRQLQLMNLAQVHVLYSNLQTQIENLNEKLVHLLMEKDERHMEQDSMLVDMEDLTRRAEEFTAKTSSDSHSNSTLKGKHNQL